jgi:hypothetical protein
MFSVHSFYFLLTVRTNKAKFAWIEGAVYTRQTLPYSAGFREKTKRAFSARFATSLHYFLATIKTIATKSTIDKT